MEVRLALEEVAKAYDEARKTFGKEEENLILGRETLRGKLLGFMTSAYYRRPKVVKYGEVVLGYAFRDFKPSPKSPYFRVWVLYSPALEFKEKPAIYVDIANKLLSYQNEGKPDKALRKFLTALNENYADATSLEVPPSLSDGHFVTLSIIDCDERRFPEFRLGYNFFLSSPSDSKELLPLHPRFIPIEVYKAYAKGELK